MEDGEELWEWCSSSPSPSAWTEEGGIFSTLSGGRDGGSGGPSMEEKC